MLSTHTSETGPDPKEVKQWIKKKLALSLKALQKHYVTSDTVVTSDDSDANALCCALEAVFIHGIKNKYIKFENNGRGKKGFRGPLPQPGFWVLLKTITHRDVITELEHLNFINTDVGRCRAWVRLALNDGLMECYLVSLIRERSKLLGYYQPSALLLDAEEREVLLSYLQGLTSLSFQLSYKSAVLNEWTVTPLVLAGLCSCSDPLDLPVSTESEHKAKDSWDSVLQSSDSDIIEVHHNSGSSSSHGKNLVKNKLTSSTLSLDTTSSSQLSSSLSSDSLLQVSSTKSPDKSSEEPWSCDSDKFDQRYEFCENSQNSLKGSVDLLNQGQDIPAEVVPEYDKEYLQSSLAAEDHGVDDILPFKVSFGSVDELNATVDEPAVKVAPEETKILELNQEKHECVKAPSSVNVVASRPEIRNTPQLSLRRASSSDGSLPVSSSLPKSRSWISEDDIYKPSPEEKTTEKLAVLSSSSSNEGSEGVPLNLDPARGSSSSANSKLATSPEPKLFRVVHRRQIGLSNPFRGLLKLGNLERRGAVGIWKEFYCELSPFEFRLYLNDDERTCAENCSLLRCESVVLAGNDGRFEVAFSSKRLYLRAPSKDEAEDWVDRLKEAFLKCRPQQQEEHWEILTVPASSKPLGSAENGLPSSHQPSCTQEVKPELVLDWTRHTQPEQDAIKESVLYIFRDNTWLPFVFSLSLEALKCFKLTEQKKHLQEKYLIEKIRDVVPDMSLGGPSFFKILTSKATLKLQAENQREAKSWRELIRGTITAYLETAEDALSPGGGDGNLHRLVQYSLKENSAFLQHLDSVPVQRGLDAQNFKCAGCPRQVGISFGISKLCEFSGQYYCDSCHQDDEAIIPSRVIHNWDLQKRVVSRQAVEFFAQIQFEPLINIENVNPSLYDHTEQLASIYESRQKLKLLGDYLMTCRSGAMKKMQAKMEKRTYLLESAHLYSIADLEEVAEGQYEVFLQSLIQTASNHVYGCDLCFQRGFICQMCNHSDIIFPFEFEATTRCKDCKAVFHSSCKTPSTPCPRCLRRLRYLERELQD
ncbi:pleckstrin homology domain-containing family M member 1 [Erpetoichthys calabaricus]|uniref:Pleckstrin homology domain containing, family M (with RUN domain) member 1 n=1 Tax=Erpetoichthys calabaricus TaxID=27687 RepID=A0A8C4T6X1_ERPCA|nr:pleckstrin homology domain-containing family M member 1 [Erpetoichthys calabaricus]XP_028674432.1 pleckstrin homology domain-containing family M member 1 [Erpetoichthys calabaricus]XP_051774864.1 pleckstrin homology domain-containing family M member 1 [Erpetoichthys calabaricus]